MSCRIVVMCTVHMYVCMNTAILHMLLMFSSLKVIVRRVLTVHIAEFNSTSQKVHVCLMNSLVDGDGTTSVLPGTSNPMD